MDFRAKALIESIGDPEYAVQIAVSDGQQVVEAMNEVTGERFVVRATELYAAAVEVVRQVGIDPEDA